jgi:hypothetical protein
MIAITEAQLEEADALAEQAEQERADAERVFATGRSSPTAERALVEAQTIANHAAARARVLRADYDEQAATREARAAAEKAALKTMATVKKQLAATREGALKAITDAEAAMTRALVAIGDHDAAVRAAASELRATGLRCDDGESTGGCRDGSLILAGEAHRPCDGPSMLVHSLAGAVAAIHPRHPVARTALRTFGGPGAAAGRRALLGDKDGQA